VKHVGKSDQLFEGGRERVTSDEEQILRGGWTVMRCCRYEGGGSENLISKWEEFVFNVLCYFEPVKRVKDQSDVTWFESFENGTCSSRSVVGGLFEILEGCIKENCSSQVLSGQWKWRE